MEVRQPEFVVRPNAASARTGLIHSLRQTLLAGFVLLISAWSIGASAADEDLPGRVARLSEPNGEVLLATPDKPDEWSPVGLNYPITSGDNLWVGNDGRAEVDFGGGQFRVSGGTNLQLSRLDDANISIFVAQGRMILRVRVLEPGDTAVVDTPNAQIALTRVGLYRFEVSADREHTQVSVREGEANVYAGNAIQQVLPGQTAAVDGFEPKYAAVTRSYGPDGFDTWSANRDRKYDRRGSTNYVSRQMVGYAELDDYGTWESAPEYGPVWYPNNVAVGWAPYRDGYWANVGAFGWTWVDVAPWGYAPFHYGRWAFVRGRWGWAPGTYVARPTWAPALVGWVGGPGWSVSATHGAPVTGWVPLGWAEPYRPGWRNCSNRCWERYNRPYAVNVAERPSNPPTRFANGNVPGAITAVPDTAFTSRRPINANLVAVTAPGAAAAPVLAGAPMVRPSPNRAPGVRVGEGAPPPASTFYPTNARPGVPGVPYRGIANSALNQPIPQGTPQGERTTPAPGNSATTLPNRPGNAPMARQSPNSAPAPIGNGNPPNNAVNTFAPRSAPPGTPPANIGNNSAVPAPTNLGNNANPPQGYRPDAINAPVTPPAPRNGRRSTPVPNEVVPGQTPGNAPPVNANATPAPPSRQSRQIPPAAQPAPAMPAQPTQQLTRPSPTTAPSAAPPMRGAAPPAAPVSRPVPPPNAGNDGGSPSEPKPQRLIRTPPPAPEGNQPAK